MVRRVKVGESEQTVQSSASEEKALSDVELSSGSGGGGMVFNLFSDHGDSDRELTQEQVYERLHTSTILQMSVAPIMRAVGEITYQWEDEREPDDWSLKSPNRWHQSAEHFGLCAAYLLLGGEYVAIKKSTAQGAELWPIPADDVDKPEVHGGKWQLEDGAIGGLTQNEFDRDELLIIQQPDLQDPYMQGRGAGQALGHDLDIDEAAAEHTASFLENHARPDALVSVDGITGDERDSFRDSMRAKHSGPGNSGKLEVFGSDVNVETLMQPFDEIGTPELRQVSAKIARQVFGVPPVLTGEVEDVNRSTAETQELVFKKHVIKPLVDKIVEAHNTQFVKPDLGENFKITTGRIVPQDKQFLLEAMKERPEAFRVDELRRLTGQEPFDDERGEQTLLEAEFAAMPATPAPAGQASRSAEAEKKITSLVVKQNEEEIERILDAVDAEDMSELRNRFATAMEEEAKATVEALDEESLDSVFGGGVLDDAVQAKVDERMGWVLPEIEGTTRDRLRSKIEGGLDEGRNPREIANEIQDDEFGGFSDVRSRRIARTEMLSATNAGRYLSHKNSSVVKFRSWLSTRDGNVRAPHLTLDQRTSENPIQVNQKFSVAGGLADHPGGFGVARLDINCRCTTIAEFPARGQRTEAERTKAWKRYAKRLDAQEQRTFDLVQSVFEAQRKRVLERFADEFDVDLEAVA